MKIGHTDIEPLDRSFAVNHARTLFLNAIRANAPNILSDLITVNCEKSLNDWLMKYNLKSDWILDAASESLKLPNGEIIWFPLSSSYEIPDDSTLPPPPIGLPAWKADSEPRAVYLSDVETLINNELKHGIFADLPQYQKSKIKDSKLEIVKKYCDAIVKAYLKLKDSRGNALWTATNEKLNLKRSALWTVKFQVLNQGFSEIANTKGETIKRPTIEKEIEAFLKLIGLNKRYTSSGRPRAQKDSKNSWRQAVKRAGILN